MPINLNTHGHNWRAIVRDNHIFCALVTPAWLHDPLMQRQYTYARELGKPIVLLIEEGTLLPPHADEHTWRVYATPEECAVLVMQIENGELTAR